MLSTTALIATFLGSLLITICYLPLIFKLHKQKEASSQSIAFWILLIGALVSISVNLFTVYLQHGTYQALLIELVNVFLAGVVLCQVVYYQKFYPKKKLKKENL